MEALSGAFCRLGFAFTNVDSFFLAVDEEAADAFFSLAERVGCERLPPFNEGEEDEEDFILFISASKTGARDLAIASRSECFDKDWEARGPK